MKYPAPIWAEDVVFTTALSSFGDRHREAALNEAFSVVAVLLDDSVPFDDYQTWGGPRGVYVGERLDPERWKELAR